MLERLLAGTRKHGVTVSAVLCAAHLIVQAKNRTPPTPRAYPHFHAIDLRRRFDPPLGDDLGCYIGGIFTLLRAGSDSRLWPLARTIHEQIKDCLDHGDHFLVPPFMSFLLKVLRPLGAGPTGVKAIRQIIDLGRRSHTGGLTNIGVQDFEPRRGPFTIEVLGFAAIGFELACVATINRRLSWNFVGMHPIRSRQRMEALADQVFDELERGVSMDEKL